MFCTHPLADVLTLGRQRQFAAQSSPPLRTRCH